MKEMGIHIFILLPLFPIIWSSGLKKQIYDLSARACFSMVLFKIRLKVIQIKAMMTQLCQNPESKF